MAEYTNIREEKKSCKSSTIVSSKNRQKTALLRAVALAIKVATFFAAASSANKSSEFRKDEGAI